MVRPSSIHARSGRILLRTLFFLLVFALTIWAVTSIYLPAAAAAAKEASEQQRRQLSAHAILVLAVVLFVLFAGLVLTFRIGRFFFPKPPVGRRQPTQYVDAWAEAGRRATVSDHETTDDEEK